MKYHKSKILNCSEQATDEEIDVEPINLAVNSSMFLLKDRLVNELLFILNSSGNKSSISGGILYS